MALTREAVVGAAVGILREFGLPDLSMRRLARDLNVQVGALYWHVRNKQELLVEVAADLLGAPSLAAPATATGPDTTGQHTTGNDGGAPVSLSSSAARGSILHVASSLHTLLLPVPDSAEVVQVARVLAPERLAPLTRMTETFTAAGLTPERAASAQSLVVNHVLGAVAEAQNRADFEITGSAADYRWALERALDGLLQH